ncbi:MAG: dihydroorotate dehydrogenase electron transfer subunit [Eggerthellaceae bacterium]|nr:dihydroorotate dehydrogenase electron transfer subunit [Eggerthellaceae bacterium]
METRFDEQGIVRANKPVGAGLYLMELEAEKTAHSIAPGQFVHLRLPRMEAHILRRPFSIYSATPENATIEILYQCVGFGTAHLSELLVGEVLDVMGPLGNTWHTPDSAERALLVGGGVGAAPLFMLAEELLGKGIAFDVVLGAQRKDALVCRTRFEALFMGGSVHAFSLAHANSTLFCATDDGSFGHGGFCTELSKDLLSKQAYDYMAVCGPEPMMRIAVQQALECDTPCEVSLEKRMACGVGACLSCVVDTSEGKKRSCVDGPVFDARKVVFA